MMDLKAAIRSIPDFPKPGIMFRDVTTLIGDARAFRVAIDQMFQPWAGAKIDKVAGTEARGFILGGAVAHQLSVGFVPVRKEGKLPGRRLSEEYALEYGTDTVEIQEGAVQPGQRVVILDDLLATGGTLSASVELLRKVGGEVAGGACIMELSFLKGRDKLDIPFESLLQYDD